MAERGARAQRKQKSYLVLFILDEGAEQQQQDHLLGHDQRQFLDFDLLVIGFD